MLDQRHRRNGASVQSRVLSSAANLQRARVSLRHWRLAKEHEPFGRFLLSTHIRATRNPKSNASSSVSNVRLRLNRWE